MSIFEALGAASSQNPVLAQAGLKSLQELQKNQGAFAEMLGVACNRANDVNVRRLAIIQFKNAATMQWRSRQYALTL